MQTFETILTHFFLINNGTAELVNIWDSFKAYIRGILKQQTALSKKKRTNYKSIKSMKRNLKG